MQTIKLYRGDCLKVLARLPDASVDALVTDPPAGIGFMGKEWDHFGGPTNPNAARDRLVARRTDGKGNQPFGYSGSAIPSKRNRRGQADRDAYRAVDPDRPGYAVQGGADLPRDARDAFVAMLTAAMAECLRVLKPGSYGLVWAIPRTSHWTALALEEAGFEIRDRISHLFGQGFPKAKSCLKPACEDWWLVRKPGRTVAALAGLDACRIGTEVRVERQSDLTPCHGNRHGAAETRGKRAKLAPTVHVGRWPANVTHDGSDEVLEAFAAFGERASGGVTHQPRRSGYSGFVDGRDNGTHVQRDPDTGTAARFYYCAKAGVADRGEGNTHPTVKNTRLMRWLCRLITPPGGLVLDPFLGSGSTAVACIAEGMRCIGIEQAAEYLAIARRRIREAQRAAGQAARA